MRSKYRYDPETGRMVDETGLPMLNQADRARPPQAPFMVSDTQPALQSMTNGQVYDSKSEMRKEYKRAGVEEVGNEKPKRGLDWIDQRAKQKKQREGIKAALHKAHSRMGFGAV